MKKLYLALFCLFATIKLFASERDSINGSTRPLIYGEVGVGTGNFNAVKLAGNYIFYEKHIVALQLYTHWRAEYPEQATWQIRSPYHIMVYGAAMYGRTVAINSFLRMNLKAGILAGQSQRPVNFVGDVVGNGSYTYDHNEKYIVGIIANPTIEVMFHNHFGMSAGITAAYSNGTPVVSAELCFIAGKLRK
ncbi:MAG: hypothetical protein EOP51_12820 [Sphingobacteriales bacterium]|nr:MAG: hypothetical protein EOP51_12820 [Sphingobacteriales bacterium]